MYLPNEPRKKTFLIIDDLKFLLVFLKFCHESLQLTVLSNKKKKKHVIFLHIAIIRNHNLNLTHFYASVHICVCMLVHKNKYICLKLTYRKYAGL